MALPTYSTGTVSVAAGGTVVTCAGGVWTGINAKQGDFISIAGLAEVLITEVTDQTHLKIAPWQGPAQTNAAYAIFQNYVGRVVGVAAAEDVGVMLEKLHVDGLPFIVGPHETVPDPSYGDEGQLAFKPSTGEWWEKTGGVWVPSEGIGGISDAPDDGTQYGRQSRTWTPVTGGSFIQAGSGAVTRTMQDKVRERVSVADFGADPTGVADSATAIQNAILSLPATGGDVFFPPGTYKIGFTLEIGNGTGSAAATWQGVRLIGAGVSAANNLVGIAGAATGTAVKLAWAGEVNGNMLIVWGTLEGWGVENILFDSGTTAYAGMVLINASYGDCSNLAFMDFRGPALLLETIGTGVSTNTMHNVFRGTAIRVPAANNAMAMQFDGVGMTSNACYNTFINTTILLPATTNTTSGIYLKNCDTNCFINTHLMGGGANARAVVLDYSTGGSSIMPCSNQFYCVDVAGAGPGLPNQWVNVGTPAAGHPPNFVYGLSQANGGSIPNLDGLAYSAPYQLGGERRGGSASPGAVGQEIINTANYPGTTLATTTAANVTSITLTPGDWDVSAFAYFVPNVSAVVDAMIASISQTSATLVQNPGVFGQINLPSLTLNQAHTSVACGPSRLNLTATTTFYLVVQAFFPSGGMRCWGQIRARRMR